MSKIIQLDLSGVNCYLVEGKSGFILFDTGGHIVTDKEFTNRRELLSEKLKNVGCTKENLRLIVLTHGDYDHVCNALYLREHFNVQIAMHCGDRELVETPTLNKWMESFQYRTAELQQLFLQRKDIITKITQKTLDDFERFTPDFFLEDGFDLSPYGLDATVLHMPGHTEGSIAILTDHGELIAGDIFANNGKPSSAFNAVNFKQLDESINKLKNFKITKVYPGHGLPFEFEEYVKLCG